MKLIVITTPHFFEGESRILSLLFQEGMERLHLRKPQSNIDELRRLLETIPPEYYPRIVLHDHFELVLEYKPVGIHLNSRNYSVPEGFKGSISRSCHSLEEIHENQKLAYVFLSPIFKAYPRRVMVVGSQWKYYKKRPLMVLSMKSDSPRRDGPNDYPFGKAT